MSYLNFGYVSRSGALGLLFGALGPVLTVVPVAAASAVAEPASLPGFELLERQARGALGNILIHERSWVRVHAAEALIAAEEAERARAEFIRDHAAIVSSSYRIGGWRVLAACARSEEERALQVKKIVEAFLDPAAPDRKQAIESLGKLGHRLDGAALAEARRQAVGPLRADTVLPVWALHLAGESGALETLTGGLRAQDPLVRQRSAYVLRWLRPDSPEVRAELARAADREPGGTRSKVFLVAAALTLRAEPGREEVWRQMLREVLLTGDAPDRFEASHALAPLLGEDDLPEIVPLLDAPEPGARVAAAIVILDVLGRR